MTLLNISSVIKYHTTLISTVIHFKNTWNDLEGVDGGIAGRYKREGICIYIGDSHCCTTETNTILQINHTPIKKNLITKLSKQKYMKWVYQLKISQQSFILLVVATQFHLLCKNVSQSNVLCLKVFIHHYI